jgi:phosphoribosylanthranilate isomerase
MTRVKICGCMRVADAVAAAQAGADFIGVLFAESRRRVAVDEAAQIAQAIGDPLSAIEQEAPAAARSRAGDDLSAWFEHGARALDRLLARKRPLVVGVFEDQDVEEVNEIADEVGLDLVQLSGNEAWSDCLRINRQVVKVVRPQPGAQPADIAAAVEPGCAIAVMLDGSRGTGTAGDLELAREVAARMPIWLAGGLSPGSVGGVARRVRPWCVDVSSGLETDGAKDAAKIAAFVRAVREAEASA